MSKLKSFIFKRPDWFKHEGYWRLAQVFRLGPAATFLVFSGFFLVGMLFMIVSKDRDVTFAAGASLGWLAGAIVYVIAAHWLIRLIVWIVEGFQSIDKANQ
ncbi:hypothetical protein A8L59_03570 [Pseudomonas koreensis]|uniref:Uncharacterized protein n=1 Tax=Pseudomonas koreensis TaxID=198620 RepID=A0AAC9BPY9_9PSED|nr:hypothetical protein [Pseudomonas koreensis]ANH96491.1 hypothetical protein A8L59_03570 [Pseudomonas koreensis]